MSIRPADLPIDEISRAALEADGLRLEVVDAADPAAHEAWYRAESRGFHGADPTAEAVRQQHGAVGPGDRLVGVFDDTVADPSRPVATTVCWPADLTLPGGRAVGAWAVSGVTVAQTHRRRGLARALMQAELRTAEALGLPVAMLTVSESTIYARFGYSPAAFARDVTVLTRRARWIGPEPSGRVHFVSREQLRDQGLEIVDRARSARPGEISYSGSLWTRQLGFSVGDENAKKLRTVRYDDADGVPQGFAIYHLKEDERDFAEHELVLHALVAATADAYAGLWKFVLETDLVSKVTAHLRPVDEPLRWMIDDFRAVRVNEFDHLWIRVLDAPAALEARTYGTSGRIVVAVDDPLAFADGTWAIDVAADGTATVSATDEPADATLTVNALGSLLLGGVTARTLESAGALDGDVDRLDRMFRSPVEPFLSIWF